MPAIEIQPLTKSQWRKFIKEWNEKYPVGTLVVVLRDFDYPLVTRTRSKAQEIKNDDIGHIWCEGVVGSYHLTHVRPFEFHPCAFSDIQQQVNECDLRIEVKMAHREECLADDDIDAANELGQEINQEILFKRGLLRAIQHLNPDYPAFSKDAK